MFKQFSKILSVIFAFPIFTSYALPPVSYEDRLYYSREEFAQDDEGKLLFKLRILGLKTSAKPKSLPTPTNQSSKGVGKLFTSGIGGDASTTFYFTNNLGAELTLGLIYVRSHNKSMQSIANNYNGNAPGKNKRIFLVPLTATAIYNIAPYGGIQPYVGAGMHATYVRSKVQNTDVKHGFGAVIQAGVDLIAKDYTLINFDIKQYMFSPKVTFKQPLVGNNISSKLKLNPLILSFGVGFKF